MERELTAAARTARLQVEMVAILRELAGVDDDDYCPFCSYHRLYSDGHDDTCPVTRARCVLAALDTPEERHARYLDSRTSEETE